MKLCLIILVLIFGLISCNPGKTETDSTNQSQTDSIFLAHTLDRALEIAGKHAKSDTAFSFQKLNGDLNDSSSYSVTVKIKVFNAIPDYSHLLIERSTPHQVCTDVFVTKDNTFKKILSSELPGLAHMGDTLMDVNGDSLGDILIKWYPISGCCRRNASDVYLARPDGTYSSSYSFINPTFFRKEKIIRGVLYGHQEDAGLYKYKWSDSGIDTLEFIYKNKEKSGSYIRISKMYLSQVQEKDKVYLSTLPEEYKNINEIDWFNGQ